MVIEMGKVIVSGHGKDKRGLAFQVYLGCIIASFLVWYVTLYLFVYFFSTSRFVRGEWIYGMMVFGEFVPFFIITFILMAVFFGSGISMIVQERNKFKSWINVFEHGVQGLSTRSESFELKYSEISSVSADERLLKAVILNISGKTLKVRTSNYTEIVAEINRRRKAKPEVVNTLCAKCGAVFVDNAAFCSGCGSARSEVVTSSCMKCGADMAANAAFCSACGSKKLEKD